MLYTVTINGTEIPEKHVLEVKTSEYTIEFPGSKLISSTTEIELSNTDYTYDDRQGTDGFFEDTTWYNYVVTIYDNENDELIWEGRLKKIQIDDSKRVVKLTVSDYIQDLVDTVCIINLTNVTVAEAIRTILIDPDRLNIPEDKLIASGFDIGISRQQNRKIDITYTSTDNQQCISVLEELCRISGSHLYMRDNKIGYWAWTQYDGILGTPIYDSDILPGSYSQETDDSKIYNEFSIAWDNSNVVAYATDTDDDSAGLYGAGKQFAMPDDEVDDTASSAFKILYTTQAGANEVITLIKARYKDLKKTCTFTGKKHLSFISLGDILDLKFTPFTREPVIVTGIKPARDKREIEFTCEFYNYPEVISLDLTAPDAVVMLEPVYYNGTIYLRWTLNNATDLMLYKLYFSTSAGYWGGEFNNGKFSPVSIPVSNITKFANTDCIYEFTPVDPGVTYFFRISAVDESYNESEYSNIVSLKVPSAIEAAYENIFNLTGDLIYSGLTLDDNPESGTGLTDWAEYDEAEYDEDVYAPTAVYESPLLTKSAGFTALSFLAYCDSGDIMIQWRSYTGGSFGTWTDLTNAYMAGFIELEDNEQFQFRVIFYSPEWADEDTFILKEVA